MITVPAYSMENEQTEPVPAVWYKKRSVRFGVAAVTGAAAVYALAFHMGKVALPVLFAGLFVKTAHDASIVKAETDNGDVVNNPTNSVETLTIEHKEIIQNVQEQSTEALNVEIPQQNVNQVIEQDMQQQGRNFMDSAWRKINILKNKVRKEATDSAARVKSEDLIYHI